MKHSDYDLTPLLRKKFANYPRTRGRYSSSELYGITHGFTSPMEWFKPKDKDVLGMLRMWSGTVIHDHIQRLLPAECNEIKKVYQYKDIQLVAKVDHLPPVEVDEAVWEFKSTEEELDEAKKSHLYQAQLYCTIHERPATKIFQPVRDEERGLFLKLLDTVSRDDEWFQAQLEKLYKFHLKVEPLWEASLKK